jgi:hypothetical protein
MIEELKDVKIGLLRYLKETTIRHCERSVAIF